jgi:succinyl-CoA synthetase beta subunit
MDRAARLTMPSDPAPGLEGESGALRLLDAYGIPVPAFEVVDDEGGLLDAAGRVGYPVVLKTASPIGHKTDVGGVVVDIGDERRLLDAYRELSSRLGAKVMVAELVTPGVEIGLGMVLDEQFGPVVIISSGGRLIELMEDRVALLPPIDGSAARRALDRLRIRPLLDGFRGGPPADVDRLADVVVRFSELATDAAGTVSAIDVNPLIVGPVKTVAVDALMMSS